jgi:hypothetical protein
LEAAMPRNRLVKVKVNETSLVDAGANQYAKIVLAKRADPAAAGARPATAMLPMEIGAAVYGLVTKLSDHKHVVEKDANAPDVFDTISAGIVEIEKAVAQFDTAMKLRETRQQIMGAVYALESVLSDLFSADNDGDEAQGGESDPYQQAAVEIAAFAAWTSKALAGEPVAGGDGDPEPAPVMTAKSAPSGAPAAGGSGQIDHKESTMSGTNTAPAAEANAELAKRDEEIAKLTKRLNEIEDQRQTEVAIAKAQTIIGTLPAEHAPALASIIKKCSEDEVKALTSLFAAANARAAAPGSLFTSVGKSVAGDIGAPSRPGPTEDGKAFGLDAAIEKIKKAAGKAA